MVRQNPFVLQTVRDITSLRIQGAQAIAKAAVTTFEKVEETYFQTFHHMSDYARSLKHMKDALMSARPTEPLLRNALNLIFHDSDVLYYDSMEKLHKHIQTQITIVLRHFTQVSETISKIGAKKIKPRMTVYTHCHSSAVMDIFSEAQKQKIPFSVCNTETRPRYQGRITASELSQKGIPVTHYVDSALRLAIKESNCIFLGADAIDYKGCIYNKIGSELICEIAKLYKVPVYICTDSWKFDPLTDAKHNEIIELRDEAEVWEKAPKGVTIKNYAFEKIDPTLVQGIISELGILQPQAFLAKVKDTYPQLRK